MQDGRIGQSKPLYLWCRHTACSSLVKVFDRPSHGTATVSLTTLRRGDRCNQGLTLDPNALWPCSDGFRWVLMGSHGF